MVSEIEEFYRGGHVFITGGTGFLGKILIEKLLRTCHGIEKIYVVIRSKRGKDSHERLCELFEDPVFRCLKSGDGELLKKVVVINGDCASDNFNLSVDDEQIVCSKVTHIFHGAATVKFDETLRQAVEINVKGVMEILTLAKKCRSLKSIVHVSTAYANCIHRKIEEKFYNPPLKATVAIDLVKNLDDRKLAEISDKIISPWPNTYTYSKAIAENLIWEQSKDLPICIVRPSIVMGTLLEPIPGWIDNMYGPTGVIAGVGTGLMRCLHADENSAADLVPVDMAANAIICAAWQTGTKAKYDNIPIIYNFTNDPSNRLTWGEFFKLSMKHGSKIPPIRAVWFITLTLTNYWCVYQILQLFFHIVPGFLMDLGLVLYGNKPRMYMAYQKIYKFSKVLAFFSTKEWEFDRKNLNQLWADLTVQDQKLFHFNMASVNWDSYSKICCEGIRKYLVKDSPSTIRNARLKMFLFNILHRLLQLLLISVLVCVLSKIFL